MKKHVDSDGRVYRSIKTGGKVYTYYDDEPVYASDVWTDLSHMQQKDPLRTGYDTQKPSELLTRIISCATKPGDTVADLFAGSGTTVVACEQNHRTALCMELDPHFVDVIIDRWETLTGEKAVLIQ